MGLNCSGGQEQAQYRQDKGMNKLNEAQEVNRLQSSLRPSEPGNLWSLQRRFQLCVLRAMEEERSIHSVFSCRRGSPHCQNFALLRKIIKLNPSVPDLTV